MYSDFTYAYPKTPTWFAMWGVSPLARDAGLGCILGRLKLAFGVYFLDPFKSISRDFQMRYMVIFSENLNDIFIGSDGVFQGVVIPALAKG